MVGASPDRCSSGCHLLRQRERRDRVRRCPDTGQGGPGQCASQCVLVGAVGSGDSGSTARIAATGPQRQQDGMWCGARERRRTDDLPRRYCVCGADGLRDGHPTRRRFRVAAERFQRCHYAGRSHRRDHVDSPVGHANRGRCGLAEGCAGRRRNCACDCAGRRIGPRLTPSTGPSVLLEPARRVGTHAGCGAQCRSADPAAVVAAGRWSRRPAREAWKA